MAPATLPGSTPADAFQDEHRNLTRRLFLIFGIRWKCGYGALPPLRAFLASDLSGGHLPRAWAVLQLDSRIRAEVVIPERMSWGAALRRHRSVAAVMLHPHHRCLPLFAAACPAVGDDHHRKAGVAQRRPLRST